MPPALPGLPYLPYGIDFASDVAPWVAETALVALLPVPPGQTASVVEASIMVAPVKDAAAFAAFRDTWFELQGEAPEVTSALGTEIYFWPFPELDDWSEPAIPEACGPAEVGADPCPWNDEVDPEAMDEGSSEAGEGELAPIKARPTPQVLRFNGAVALPLTVSPLHGDEELEVEVPVPLPEFGPSGLAVAFLPDALIAAENPAVLEQYLRLRQEEGQNSLADRREFQRTLVNRQRAGALLAVYGNALELLNYDFAATALPANLPLPLPPASLDDDTRQTLRSQNFGGTLEGLVYPLTTGMQFRGRYYYDAVPFTFGLTPTVAEADQPLELLPASTLVVVSGRNLAGLWRGVTHILTVASDVTREGLGAARAGFTLLTGLDLDDDVFGWMDGEYAIAAFPATDSPFQDFSPELHLGLGLLLQTSDRATATNTLTVLGDLAAGYEIESIDTFINGQPVTSLGVPHHLEPEPLGSAPYVDYTRVYDVSVPLLSYGWLTDDTLALISGLGPMTQVMLPTPHDPLTDFFLFDQATAAFPTPNDGYLYLNVGATLALAYQVFDLHDDPSFDALKPYLGSLRSLSATTALTPNHMELQGQLGLAPRQE